MAEVDVISVLDATEVSRDVATTSKQIKTIGLPIDDKSSSTDTTSVSHTSLLKYISYVLQDTNSRIAAGNVIVSMTGSATSAKQDSIIGALGANNDTVAANDTGSYTLVSLTKRMLTKLNAGQSSKANSLSVSIASDDDLQSKLGIITETAPASDTASSGLNGRLQRVSQRLTSLIALLPTSLGANGGLKIDGSGVSIATNSKGKYNSTLPVLVDGDFAELQIGSSGVLISSPVKARANGSDTISNSGVLGKVVDSSGSETFLAAAPIVFNGSTWDRLRGNTSGLFTLSAQLPAALGQTSKANSISISIASDDDIQAKLGAINETAPSTDTANSGINGRLQRIAQRVANVAQQSTLSNVEDRIGSTSSTAPAADDTASVGLNGRLIRIASRITSLIGVLPASLGSKNANASLSVTLANNHSNIEVVSTSGVRILDSGGNTISVTPPGQNTKNNSASVTIASDDNIQAKLDAINTSANNISNIITPGIVTVSTDITRPADTSGYITGDAFSDSTSAPTTGGFTLTGAARASGKSGQILDMIVTSSNPAGGLYGEILVFDTAVTAVNDNAALGVTDAEIKTLVGKIPFTLNAGANNSSAQVMGPLPAFTTVGSANLRFLVRVGAAYTPISAEVLTVRCKILQVN